MLVVLPHGTCVDPDVVKFLSIRADRPQGPGKPMVFTVAMKTDADDNQVLLATFDDRGEAESLAYAIAEKLEKLVQLPHGACVDPEIVKYVTIRVDRPLGMGKPVVFTVVLKTDADDNPLLLATFDDRAEAEALVEACAARINGASEDDDGGGDDDEDDEAEEEEETSAPASDVDDDW
jgi:hypothetical protein